MKVNVFKQLFEIFKRNKNVNLDKTKDVNGYIKQDNNIEEKINVINNDDLFLKEKTVDEIYNYIEDFFNSNTNNKFELESSIKEEEWKLFLEIVYDEFIINGIAKHYERLILLALNYVFYKHYVFGNKKLNFSDLIEDFDINFLPLNVSEKVIKNVKEKIYLKIKKN